MITKPPLRNSGDTVNNHYKIIKLLGQGANGEVYVALDPVHNRQVAIKYLKWQPDKPIALEQFKTEFSTLTHLSHPHIARVYDFERDEDNNQFFFTSELIDGKDFMNATHGTSPKIVEELFVQALRALEYLHGNGILHFDIKAANLLVEGTKHVKLIDFGLATIRFQGKLSGTPSYMAPEMIWRDNPDRRADLYSLGVLVYSALTGANPFRANTMDETFQNQLSLTPKPPSSINPNVPKYLDGIIMRLLEKKPLDRFQTAAEVIQDLNLRSPKQFKVETEETQSSYIPWESKFIGRIKELERVTFLLKEKYPAVILVRGGSGSGKSRFLTEIKHISQVSEWTTLFLTDLSHFAEWQKSVMEDHKQPTIIGIDDIHILTKELWGGDIEDLCTTISRRIGHGRSFLGRGAPLTLIVSADDGYKPGWAKKDFLDIKLTNFPLDETKEYITAVTGVSNPPPPLVKEIYKHTGGNPFVLTEVIKALVTSGRLVDSQGRWKETTFEDINIGLDHLEIPSTVEERLISDFATLPEELKAMAEFLAVFEKPVPLDAVEKLSGLSMALGTLMALSNKELVMRDPTTNTYFFKRPLMARAIYHHISEADRTLWHDRIAAHLAKALDDEDFLYHTGRGSDSEQARYALAKLIDRQLKEQKSHEAIFNALFYIERWKEAQMELSLARLYNRIGKYDLTIKTINNIKEMQNPEMEVAALEITGIAHLNLANYNEALKNFQAALQIANSISITQQLRIENYLAEVLYYEGKITEAIKIYERTVEMVKGLPHEEQIKILNNNLGQSYFQNRDYKKAVAMLEQELTLYKEVGDRRLIVRTQYMLAESYRMEHLFDKSSEQFNALIKDAKETDDLEHLFRAYNGLGNLYSDHGNFESAASYYERALDVSSRLGHEEQSILCLAGIGIANSNMGNLKKAYESLSSALAFLEGSRLKSGILERYHCFVHLEISEVLRLQKQFTEAKRHIKEAEVLATTPSTSDLVFWIKFVQLEIAIDTNDKTSLKNLYSEAEKFADSKEKKEKLAGLKL